MKRAFLAGVLLAIAGGIQIKADLRVSSIYKQSDWVASGEVTAVDAAAKIIEAKLTQTFKGEAGTERVRLQVAQPEALLKQAAVGQAVMLFSARAQGRVVGIAHVADQWTMAEGLSPGAWRIFQARGELAPSFPGRTWSLTKIVAAIKEGTPTYLDELEDGTVGEEPREVADLGAAPAFLIALESELLAGGPGGVRLLARPGYEDVTAARGLSGAAGAHAAAAGSDLLIGTTLWRRDGERYTGTPAAGLPDPATWLACGIGKDGAVVVTRDGKLAGARRAVLWKEGPAPKAVAISRQWDDDDELCVLAVFADRIVRWSCEDPEAPPDDLARLTGTPLSQVKGIKSPLDLVLAAPVDYDGNGLADYLIVTRDGGLTLAGRGHGAFMLNQTLHRPLVGVSYAAVAFVPAPKPALPTLAAATREGKLLVWKPKAK